MDRVFSHTSNSGEGSLQRILACDRNPKVLIKIGDIERKCWRCCRITLVPEMLLMHLFK